jgi:KDO2-lipid IV(A) lauroyltransferase
MMAYVSYRVADALVGALPDPAAEWTARTLARALHALHVPARARLERNLERLGGPRLARTRSREAFEHFAMTLTDFLRLGHVTPRDLDRRVRVEGEEHLDAARRTARGVIVVSAHAGSWELGAAWLAARGIRLRIVARPHPSAAVERFFLRRRARWGVLPLEGGSTWLAAARALRSGEWVAIMVDRAGRRGSPCAWVAALARRTGCRVLPAVMRRGQGGGHLLCCGPLEDGSQGATRTALASWLAGAPEQWCAFRPAPEGLA